MHSFRPDVMVGSSFGGAVVLELIQRGIWSGPALLLCPAHNLIARCHDVSEDNGERETKGSRTVNRALPVALPRGSITNKTRLGHSPNPHNQPAPKPQP